MTISFCLCLFWMDLSTLTSLPLMSFDVRYIAVEYDDGVGVNTWTCSGRMCSTFLQYDESSLMSSSVHPGWAAMK